MKNIFGATDVGLIREENQDMFTVEKLSENLAFAVLCDGMGGEAGGNIAARVSVEHAAAALKRGLNGELSELTIKNIMMSAISGANALVYDMAQKDEALSGMGTTMIVAVFLNRTLYAAYVGDSRVYCVSSERELQVTHDHTVVQMLVDLGQISDEDAKTHPKRHYITRAVGISSTVAVDFAVQELESGDIVLICSDGLYSYLEEGLLYGLLEVAVERGGAEPLIEFAKAGGGADNITAVVYCEQ